MVSRALLAALLLGGLAACQTGGTGVATSAKAVTYTGALPQPSPIKVQRLTEGGDYVHQYTGMVFPDHLGDMERNAILISTENADDVGANYKIPGRQDFVGTGIVFPIWNVIDRPLTVSDIPDACEDGYEDARDTAQERLVNARIVKEEAITNPQFSDAVFTRVVVFEADGGNQSRRLSDPKRTLLAVRDRQGLGGAAPRFIRARPRDSRRDDKRHRGGCAEAPLSRVAIGGTRRDIAGSTSPSAR